MTLMNGLISVGQDAGELALAFLEVQENQT